MKNISNIKHFGEVNLLMQLKHISFSPNIIVYACLTIFFFFLTYWAMLARTVKSKTVFHFTWHHVLLCGRSALLSGLWV